MAIISWNKVQGQTGYLSGMVLHHKNGQKFVLVDANRQMKIHTMHNNDYSGKLVNISDSSVTLSNCNEDIEIDQNTIQYCMVYNSNRKKLSLGRLMMGAGQNLISIGFSSITRSDIQDQIWIPPTFSSIGVLLLWQGMGKVGDRYRIDSGRWTMRSIQE
jgi:hypothetical protein